MSCSTDLESGRSSLAQSSFSFRNSVFPWPLHTKIPPNSLSLFTTLLTADGDNPKFIAIGCTKNSLNCQQFACEILLRVLSQESSMLGSKCLVDLPLIPKPDVLNLVPLYLLIH